MKCYYHNTEDAVGQCLECGRELCSSCMDKYDPPLCMKCVMKFLNKEKMEKVYTLILTMVLMIIGYFSNILVGDNESIKVSFIFAILYGGIPCGWTFITNQTNIVLQETPAILFVFYIVIKLISSFIIGWAVLPYVTVSGIIRLFSIHKSKKSILKNEIFNEE